MACTRRSRDVDPIDQLLALRAQLVTQLAGPMRVATPQLGEVEYRSADDMLKAMAAIDSMIAAASGASPFRRFVVVSDRGLGGL